MSLAQGTACRRTQHRRAVLHSLDQIFRPKDASDPAFRKYVPSLKTFRQGCACYATRKTLLSWIVYSVLGIVALPAHRYERLLAIFDELHGLHRISLKNGTRCLGSFEACHPGRPGSLQLSQVRPQAP
jgi:hypothetical protein